MFRSLLAARPAFRSFSATSAAEAKLYVGNLSWGANEEALREQFGKFGQVTDCFIVRDTLSGRSKVCLHAPDIMVSLLVFEQALYYKITHISDYISDCRDLVSSNLRMTSLATLLLLK